MYRREVKEVFNYIRDLQVPKLGSGEEKHGSGEDEKLYNSK